jgi:hypothetical protein
VKLSDVLTLHIEETAYAQELEAVVRGWQQWYADLKKRYTQ